MSYFWNNPSGEPSETAMTRIGYFLCDYNQKHDDSWASFMLHCSETETSFEARIVIHYPGRPLRSKTLRSQWEDTPELAIAGLVRKLRL